MSLMEKLRNLFQGPGVPEETRQIYTDAKDPRELVQGLEQIRGRNEIDLRDSEQELIGLDKAIALEEASIRRGGLTRTEEDIALRRIDRLGKQRANLERQTSIYNQNVNLHLDLIARIQEMEAMRSRQVTESDIDGVVERVEDSLQEYKRVNIAAEAGSTIGSAVDESAERRRLDEIKKRILGSQESASPAVPEDPPRQKSLE
jgi:hypothetical protein